MRALGKASLLPLPLLSGDDDNDNELIFEDANDTSGALVVFPTKRLADSVFFADDGEYTLVGARKAVVFPAIPATRSNDISRLAMMLLEERLCEPIGAVREQN